MVFSGEREGTEEPNLPSGTLARILAGYATDRKAVAPIVAVLGIDVATSTTNVRIEVVSVRGRRSITRPPVAIRSPIDDRTVRPVVVAGTPEILTK